MEGYAGLTMRLVAGNTGSGVYKDRLYEDVVINLQHVEELRQVTNTEVRTPSPGLVSRLYGQS